MTNFSAGRRLAASALIFAAACGRGVTVGSTPAPAPAAARAAGITDGRALLGAMYDTYKGRWYKTLTFTQRTTTTPRAGGADIVQTWYEAAKLPGNLRIDIDVPSKGNGALYARDSIFSVSGGRITRADTGLNALLVLGFDVYAQPPAASEAVLRHLGFNLNALHDDVWQGKPVYVVGAAAGDTTSKQFWVTKNDLLFVRLIQTTPRGRAEFQFNKYVRAGGGWVAAEVVQMLNGRRTVLEEYTTIRADVPLSDALFDPRQWSTAPHWYIP